MLEAHKGQYAMGLENSTRMSRSLSGPVLPHTEPKSFRILLLPPQLCWDRRISMGALIAMRSISPNHCQEFLKQVIRVMGARGGLGMVLDRKAESGMAQPSKVPSLRVDLGQLHRRIWMDARSTAKP